MKNTNKLSNIIVPAISVLAALVIGSLILLISGKSPVALFVNIFN